MSSDSAPIKPSEFVLSKVVVAAPRLLDNGSQAAYTNYDGGRLRIQAPTMPIPYAASDYQGNKNYKVSLSFRDRGRSAKVERFYKTIEAIDNFIIDTAHKNAGKWFKLPGASREMIALLYTASIRTAKDKEGNAKDLPPTIQIALKQRNGAFDTVFYEKTGAEIEGGSPLTLLKKHAEVYASIEATGIWIADKKFGLTWKLVGARMDAYGEGSGAGRSLLAADSDDEGEATGGAGVSATEESSLMAAVLPSEEAEDEEDEGEVLPAPPVPAKKAAAAPATAAPATAAPATAAVAAVAAPATVKKVVKKVVAKA